jgi:hypothetical protein
MYQKIFILYIKNLCFLLSQLAQCTGTYNTALQCSLLSNHFGHSPFTTILHCSRVTLPTSSNSIPLSRNSAPKPQPNQNPSSSLHPLLLLDISSPTLLSILFHSIPSESSRLAVVFVVCSRPLILSY